MYSCGSIALLLQKNILKRIVIFASGAGTNAEKIISYFTRDNMAVVQAVFTNNPNAGVIDVCRTHHICHYLFNNKDIEQGDKVLERLSQIGCDCIVLAGFLRKLPKSLIAAYPNKIINLHPSLLPKYGGQGMYGNKVHQAVLDNKEIESGITIHLVNEEYDKGAVLAQFSCNISHISTIELLANRLQELEHEHYPKTIKKHIEHV